MTARRRLSPNLDLLSLRSFFLPCSRRARQTRQADAVPVCTATPMADVISIELTTSARSATSGAMDAVARMLETIHLSQHGQMLRVDAAGAFRSAGSSSRLDRVSRRIASYHSWKVKAASLR
jgi:hypothetical protein